VPAVDPPRGAPGFTRAGLLRALAGGGAAVAGGAALRDLGGDDPLAAPSASMDTRILRLFLRLEYAQEDFYRQALASAPLSGRLKAYATAVAEQERAHVGLLERRLGADAPPRPGNDLGDRLRSARAFRAAAVQLEEAAIALYIGQATRLRPAVLKDVAVLISVEARQAAWIRDLAGDLPAPRPADAARGPRAVLADLRDGGFLA
jgi:rubrerythrin